MSIEIQKSILKLRRLQKSLNISQLCKEYEKYESGQYDFSKANCETGYSIITDLNLSMDDLQKMFEH